MDDTRDTFGGMVSRSFLPAARPSRPRAVAVLAALLVLVLPAGVADAAPAPGAPSITSVTPGDGTLTVAFTPPAGGCTGCTYIVEASVSADFATFAARSTSQTSPVTLVGLTNGTEYHVRAHVRVLGLGSGEISEFVGDGTIGGAGIRYRVHTFAPAGSFVLQVDRDVDVEALVVAGGGSGGSGRGGGGGGAGGMIQAAPTLSAGTHTITVGAGGESRTNARGESGADSVLPASGGALTAVGGGGGGSGAGSSTTDPVRAGLPGGSGGGSRTNTNLAGGTGVTDQGNDGGRGLTGGLIGGGGGGADGPGADGGGGGTTPTAPFGEGGPGKLSSITGASLFYAAGGGGGGTSGVFPNLSNGGTGGGGDGARGTGGDEVGSPGTTPGSGGGGGGNNTTDASGAGADGIVILRHIMNVAVHPVTVAAGVPVPVTARDSGSGAAPLTLTCDPSTPVAGGALVCRISGGDPDVDILWRAAVGSDVIEGVVRTTGDGSGEFRVDLPRASAGQAVSIELVAWLAPIELGAVRDVIPTGVPAGSGRSTEVHSTLTILATAALMLALSAIGRQAAHAPGRLRWRA